MAKPTSGARVFDTLSVPRYPFGRSNFRRAGLTRSLEFFPLSELLTTAHSASSPAW
jgi:hypothetical protein